jgi:chromosome partitioning protein
MADVANPFGQHKIVVLNPKGGSGKTTIATNLASYYATHGSAPTIVDCDSGGYSLRWIEKRPGTRPVVHGVAGFGDAEEQDCRPHPDSKEVIYDLPAGLGPSEIFDYVYDASSILLPIVPSEIDIYAAARFIADLLLIVQLDRRKLAIVGNRVRKHTKSSGMLQRFLTSLDIPVIANLRDSQNFVQASAFGLGINELPPSRAGTDLAELEHITGWLDRWKARQLHAFLKEELGRSRDAPAVAQGGARHH